MSIAVAMKQVADEVNKKTDEKLKEQAKEFVNGQVLEWIHERAKSGLYRAVLKIPEALIPAQKWIVKQLNDCGFSIERAGHQMNVFAISWRDAEDNENELQS